MTAFASARLKVQRAKRHIHELNYIVDAFLKTDFCKLHIEADPKTGVNFLKLDSLTPVPSEVSLVVGDAVHNLRAAFDHIVTFYVGKDDDRITFPTGTKRNDLVDASRSLREIKIAFPDLADFIVDKIQPYRGGDFKVWEIARLDNFDKHKLLIPVTSIQALTGICAEDENGNRIIDCTASVEQGVINFRAYGLGSKTLKITSYGKPAVRILFPKSTFFENEPVIPTLLNLSEITLKAIDALESFCFGKVANPNVPAV